MELPSDLLRTSTRRDILEQEGTVCRVLHELDCNTAEALSGCGEKDGSSALPDVADCFKVSEMAYLVSKIAADSELSRNPPSCRQGQLAAALLLRTAVAQLPSIPKMLLQEDFLGGLVLMVDEGSSAIQIAAAGLLAALASDAAAREAICQAQGGLVVAMMLKTSQGPAERAAAANCLVKLLPQLSPMERQILWSVYAEHAAAPAGNEAPAPHA